MRGGKRPGAGRPKMDTPRVNFTLSVSTATAAHAKALRERGIKVNHLVAQFLADEYRRICLEEK